MNVTNRLKEIKEEYAKNNYYDNWNSFVKDQNDFDLENHFNYIYIKYTYECIEASLEKAYQNHMPIEDLPAVEMTRHSMINPNNIILL